MIYIGVQKSLLPNSNWAVSFRPAFCVSNTCGSVCRNVLLGVERFVCMSVCTWWDVYYPRGKYNSTSEISVLPFNKLAACCFQIFISYKEIHSTEEDPANVKPNILAFHYIIYVETPAQCLVELVQTSAVSYVQQQWIA